MKKSILVLVLVSFNVFIFSQVTGYAGKRLIINSDLLSPTIERGVALGAEYAFSRKMSVIFDYSFANRFYKERVGETNYDVGGPVNDSKTFYQSHAFEFGVKYYANRGFNAPHGNYLIGKLGYAITSSRGTAKFQDEFGGYETRSYKEVGIKTIYAKLGVGKQWVIKKWVTVDLSLGFMTGGSLNSYSEVGSRVGANLFTINQFGAEVGYTIGLWGGLKIGILLPI